jgi:putative 2OG-Fe(II) oxygenase
MPITPYKLPVDIGDEVARVCSEMWDLGYSKIGKVLSVEEVDCLKNLLDPMMKGCRPWADRWTSFDSSQYFLPPFGDNDQIMLSNIAGRDSRLDLILENIMTNKYVKESLAAILGEGYKAWELSARRSNAIDHGLRLHEDAIGEFGISVLLNDQFDAYGATSLVPKSHRSKVGCREAGVEDYLRPSFMKQFCRPVTGSAGDVFFFFKKTWHGRIQSTRPAYSDCLLFGLFPAGYRFKPFHIPLSDLQRLPDELKRLLRTDEGCSFESDNYCRVNGNIRSDRMIDLIYKKEYAINSIWDYGPCIKPSLDFIRSAYVRTRDYCRRMAR